MNLLFVSARFRDALRPCSRLSLLLVAITFGLSLPSTLRSEQLPPDQVASKVLTLLRQAGYEKLAEDQDFRMFMRYVLLKYSLAPGNTEEPPPSPSPVTPSATMPPPSLDPARAPTPPLPVPIAVSVTCTPSTARISIDGEVKSPATLKDLRLPPRKTPYRFLASAEGYESESREIHLEPNRPAELSFNLRPSAPSPPPPSRSKEPDGTAAATSQTSPSSSKNPSPPPNGLTGRQIMEQQKARHESRIEFEQIIMVLIDDRKNTEERHLFRYSKKGPDGLFKYLILFERPQNIRGTALLTWQQKKGDDNQRLYLPDLRQMKPIVAGSKRTPFMGTDFAYEDMRGESLDSHNYQLRGETNFGGQECHLVEAVAANDKALDESGYSKRLLWITASTLVTVKTDFYDKQNNLLKTATAHDIEAVDGRGQMMRPGKLLMVHHKNHHQTLMGTVKRDLNSPIDDEVFTENYVVNAR